MGLVITGWSEMSEIVVSLDFIGSSGVFYEWLNHACLPVCLLDKQAGEYSASFVFQAMLMIVFVLTYLQGFPTLRDMFDLHKIRNGGFDRVRRV